MPGMWAVLLETGAIVGYSLRRSQAKMMKERWNAARRVGMKSGDITYPRKAIGIIHWHPLRRKRPKQVSSAEEL